MALSRDQKDFIEEKVRRLGSMKKVKLFYKRESLVCKYAIQFANKIFNGKERKNERMGGCC